MNPAQKNKSSRSSSFSSYQSSESNKKYYGLRKLQPSLIHLKEPLEKELAYEDEAFLSYIGYGDKEEKKIQMEKLLRRPSLEFSLLVNLYCRLKNIPLKSQSLERLKPIIINHNIQATECCEDQYRKVFKSILKRKRQEKQIKQILKGLKKTKEGIISQLKDFGCTVYVHTKEFPSVEPEKYGKGKFIVHFLEYKQILFNVELDRQARERLEKYYTIDKKERGFFNMIKVDWTLFIDEFIKNWKNIEQEKQQTNAFEIVQDLIVKKRKQDIYSEEKPIVDDQMKKPNYFQEIFNLKGYQNYYLDITEDKVFKYSKLEDVNLIIFYGVEIKNLGQIGSFFLKDGLQYVQILAIESQGNQKKTIFRLYEDIEEYIEFEPWFYRCRICKDMIGKSGEMIDHEDSCQQ